MGNGKPSNAPTWDVWLGNIAMLQGYACHVQASLGPAWTLGIECLFYLFAPLFLRMPAWSIVGLMGVSAALFPSHFLTKGEPEAMKAVCLLWPWLAGWLAYSWKDRPALLLLLTAGTLMLVQSHATASSGAYAMTTLAVAMMALCFARQISLNVRADRAFKYLGELSYPLYMIHFPAMFLLYGVLKGTTFNHPAVYLSVYLLASAAIYHFVDAPIRYRKKREADLPVAVPVSA
jgi:peptidoglycan/LPS O-acetylase OafA/YrhL